MEVLTVICVGDFNRSKARHVKCEAIVVNEISRGRYTKYPLGFAGIPSATHTGVLLGERPVPSHITQVEHIQSERDGATDENVVWCLALVILLCADNLPAANPC
ncbi:hypothetical protein SK128_001586 [Halocaridina rubra]|uniref:Uncharacterized protein n=1 Tax=Halocaridina rubra TaxID=373956 RepID=A0AAN8XDM3_HALRR